MANVDHYILGDATLHERLCITTGILAELVLRAPRSIGIAKLENATGYQANLLQRTCRDLCRAGLLQADPQVPGNWHLAAAPGDITLEDVFRMVLAQAPSRGKRGRSATPVRAPNDVDLLVMQATVGINQNVFSHLRRFSLDRLKVSAAGMFPAMSHSVFNTDFGEMPFEPH